MQAEALRPPPTRNVKTIATSEALPHLGYLDSLRGLAILGVLAVHTVALNEQTSWVARPLRSGSAGVELFYMVSAFTLFLSLDTRNREHHPTRNFFLRRFFRIAPMFYLSIVLNIARLRFDFVHGRRPAAFEYLLAFLFLFGFKASTVNSLVVGGWSVAVETTFYALLPLLHRWIGTLRAAVIAFLCAFVSLVPPSLFLARLYFARGDADKFIFFALAWFPIQLPIFLFGIVLYFFWKEKLTEPASRRSTSAVLLLITAAGMFLVPSYSPSYLPAAFLVMGIFFFAVLFHPWGFLVNGATRYLGKISYSFYLLHFFVSETVPKLWVAVSHQPETFLGLPLHHLPSLFAMYAVIGGLSVLVCTASFKWIEQPCIRLGRRLIARLEHRAVQQAALPNLTSPLDTPEAQM